MNSVQGDFIARVVIKCVWIADTYLMTPKGLIHSGRDLPIWLIINTKSSFDTPNIHFLTRDIIMIFAFCWYQTVMIYIHCIAFEHQRDQNLVIRFSLNFLLLHKVKRITKRKVARKVMYNFPCNFLLLSRHNAELSMIYYKRSGFSICVSSASF